jgi:16S rRNA (cytidine1402-2'-O)-methyltransferase
VVFFEAPHRIRQTLVELQTIVGDCRVSLGRELTKAHEELVRGHISDVILGLEEPRGEFTVVAEIGLSTENAPPEPPSARDLLVEFGDLTNSGRLNRREAVSMLAKRYGMSSRMMYQLLETAKQSVE